MANAGKILSVAGAAILSMEGTHHEPLPLSAPTVRRLWA